jgi:beta-mannosidase
MEADDELRRVLPEPSFDDRGWPALPVPGQWRSSPDFATSDGPVLYRRRFEGGAGEGRTWLTFDGMFYQADVWLDGSYLGDTEGYFAPHTFEVTDHVQARDSHLLAVELACPPETDPGRRRNLTGALQGGDGIDPSWNPGGIWAGVGLHQTGEVRLASLRVICREATDQRAAIDLEGRLDAAISAPVEVTTTVRRVGAQAGDADITTTSNPTMSTGRNRVRWRVTIERPELWWPRALGGQPLYEIEVSVRVDGRLSDARTVTTGLRQVRMQRWITTINGERVFLKGANFGPSRRALSEITPGDVAADLALACHADLNLLRVRGHVATTELYDQADRLGMLLWQDLPMYGHYAGTRRRAAIEARRAVDLLGHHPSVVLWCGHNDPTETGDDPAAAGERITRRALRQALPDLPGMRLDRSVRRAIERTDGSRPVVAHSGVLPHPAGGTDTRLYPGWSDGELDLAGLLARWPALARFVGEFGAQAVPTSDAFAEPERWPDLDWDRLETIEGLDRDLIDRWSPPAGYATFEAWRDATQAHQADVIRRCVETLRRLKYRPTGGFCVAGLADAQPAISAAVVDYLRVPKAGYASLKAACAPVIVVADHPVASYRPGETMTAAIHVVSDLRTPIPDVEADVTLTWPGGGQSWSYGGQIGADACTRIGKVVAPIPATCLPGPVHLDLQLRWGDQTASGGIAAVSNSYTSRVGDPAEPADDDH